MTGTAERKLTTIFCADAAGYSAMMDRDEDGTLATLKDYRGRMRALIARHRGRVVNTAGDGLMAEFASPVEAVRCATEVQRELGDCNADRPIANRMQFRIGINLGDVMIDEDDLFGEGVNIAARLEALAEPGGILIASTVFDQVKTKLPIRFDFLGEQHVKNITHGIPTYRVSISQSEWPDSLASQSTEGHRQSDAHWTAYEEEDVEDLASYSDEASYSDGPSEEWRSDRGPDHRGGFTAQLGQWFEKVVGRTEVTEAQDIAKRSTAVGLVLAAIALITPLDWVIWPGIAIAFGGAQMAISRAGWGKRQTLRARLVSIIGLVIVINLVTSFGQWWFIYPAIALGVIAFLVGDGRGGRWHSRDQSS